MKRKNIFYYSAWVLSLLVVLTACNNDEEYEVPVAKRELQNDCIKRSIGPNLAGLPIEFAYAMALPQDMGTLVSAQVEASIPGGAGTYLEHHGYYTASNGADVPVTVGNPSTTEGNLTQVTFTRDTFAVTLRYFYIIPPEARGQSVKFKFSAKATNGQTVSYDMGPYTISNMDMALDKTVSDGNAMYISIADMTVYTAAEAAANPDKIDLVYLYRTKTNFAHALVAPTAPSVYLDNITLPAGVTRDTKIIKNLNLRDKQLARLQYGIYIDDIDFQKLDVNMATNFALNVKNEGGVWVETADGQYRAFVYINSINNTAKSMVVSMKRLQMK